MVEINSEKIVNRWSAELVDSADEDLYRLQAVSRQRFGLLAFCVLCVFAAPIQIIGTWSNVADNPAAIQGLLVQRGISVLLYAVLFVVCFRANRFKSLDVFAIIIAGWLIYNVISMQEFSDAERLGLVFRGIIVMLLVLFMLELRFSYFLAVYVAISGTLIYQYSYFLELSGGEANAAVVSIVFLFVVGVVYRWQQERQRRIVFKLNNTLVNLHVELKDANQQLEKMAHTDVLTGIANRREYDRFLRAEDQRSKRTNRKYALAIIDIDNFKLINDTHGHAAGDVVLTRLAKTFVDKSRKYELVARIGGEEFAIIFSEIDEEQIVAKLNSLRQIIQGIAFEDIGSGLSCTVSIGIAISGADKTIAEIQKEADQALYHAKDSGRNQVVLHGIEFPE